MLWRARLFSPFLGQPNVGTRFTELTVESQLSLQKVCGERVVEKGALIENVRSVFGLPCPIFRVVVGKNCVTLSTETFWKSLKLDPAYFCLRDFSGRLIGMIIVHVDDMLQATNNSHHAEYHIPRLLWIYDITNIKRADSDEGVLYCGKRVRTMPNDMRPGGLALQQDRMEFVKSRCEPASMSRVRARQEGAQCTTGEIREMRSMTWNFALGNRRNTSRRVSCRGNNQHPWCLIMSAPYKLSST